MFRLGTENPWFCHSDTDMEVDFCIWVLEADGLRVPPFEHHSGGDGTLQAAGLGAENWRSWVKEVIGRKDQHHFTSQQQFAQRANDAWKEWQAKGKPPMDMQSEDSQQHMQAFTQQLMQAQSDLLVPKRPPEVWSGSPDIGKRLDELWKQYGPISKKRLAWERSLMGQRRRQLEEKGTANSLWHDLEPYHTRLDSLMIHFVAYSQERDYLVPPRSTIMTIVDGHLDDEDFRTRALQAAEALAARLSS